jgi:hypothetical protein
MDGLVKTQSQRLVNSPLPILLYVIAINLYGGNVRNLLIGLINEWLTRSGRNPSARWSESIHLS